MPKASLPIKLLLPLALFVASWQFSSSALGEAVIISGSRSCRTSSSTPTKGRELAKAILLANSPRSRKLSEFGVGVDGAGCILPENEEGQRSPDSAPADSSSDIEDNDADLDDLNADSSTRTDHDTPLFSVAGLDAVTLRTPRIVPILLVPVHCFYCLHEHIRERAPPTLS